MIDARLLTSYEVKEEDREPTRRVEIIHESLLANWPRLVRWQTQDADAAQLRDEVRQSARAWDEHGRHDDRLWTGTAFREFVLWRERYPGGLTELEEDFSAAMTSLATRRRRRRRNAVAAGFAILLAVLAVVATFWRRSVLETRRAEAGKLLALAQTQLERDNTAALAYTRASIELADTPEARRLAVEILWRGPVARILPVFRMARELGIPQEHSPIARIAISPDGRWLATMSEDNRRFLIFPSDGGPARTLPHQPGGNVGALDFGPRGDVLVTGGPGDSLRMWSHPELEVIREMPLGGAGSVGLIRGEQLLTITSPGEGSVERLTRTWALPSGELGAQRSLKFHGWAWDFDPEVTTMAYSRGTDVLLRPLGVPGTAPDRVLGSAKEEVLNLTFAPEGNRLAALDGSGEIMIFSTLEDATGPPRVVQGPSYVGDITLEFDAQGRYLVRSGPNYSIHLWDLNGPPGARPTVVGRFRTGGVWNLAAFDPEGQWLATTWGLETIELWPLQSPRSLQLPDFASTVWFTGFTRDSRYLAICSLGERVRLWPLHALDGDARELTPPEECASLATDFTEDRILIGAWNGQVVLQSLAGEPSHRLSKGWRERTYTMPVAFDPAGGRAFASPQATSGFGDPRDRVFCLWDLKSGEQHVHSLADIIDGDWMGFASVGFAPDGSLFVAGPGNVRRLVLPEEPGGAVSSETVLAAGSSRSSLSRDGQILAVLRSERGGWNQQFEELLTLDLSRGSWRRITTHGRRLASLVLDSTGHILVTGDIDGVVRIGPVTGEEPHQLIGHDGQITGLAISPEGRWVASANDDSVRLWPMPNVSKPPLHTLAHDELLAKLDTLTNLRAVPDLKSHTGWKLEVGPFPGWAEVPEW